MTFKGFQIAKDKIMRERFYHVTGDALEHAISRNRFEQRKLHRLIDLAQGLRGSKTISRQVDRWKSMLNRMDAKLRRMQALHKELKANALTVRPPLTQIRGLGTFRSTSSENRKGSSTA